MKVLITDDLIYSEIAYGTTDYLEQNKKLPSNGEGGAFYRKNGMTPNAHANTD